MGAQGVPGENGKDGRNGIDGAPGAKGDSPSGRTTKEFLQAVALKRILEKEANMKIFMTGGSGYIGSAIKNHLQPAHEVYAPSRIEWPMDLQTPYAPPACDAAIFAHGTIGHVGPFTEMRTGDWMRAMRVNFHGTLSAIHQLPKSTRIIVLTGGGGFSHPCLSSYFASKAALKAMIPALASEGYRIAGIAPGPQPSKMIREALSMRGAGQIENTLRDILSGKNAVPLQGTLTVTDKILDTSFSDWGQIFAAREYAEKRAEALAA